MGGGFRGGKSYGIKIYRLKAQDALGNAKCKVIAKVVGVGGRPTDGAPVGGSVVAGLKKKKIKTYAKIFAQVLKSKL